jgi:predicted dipeptidase
MGVPRLLKSRLWVVFLSSIWCSCKHGSAPLHDRAVRAWTEYDEHESALLVPMLTQAIQFATVAGNARAHADQKAWLAKVGRDFGMVVRDAGKVTEIELPGPSGAAVLGLLVHGDVQPVEEKAWSAPPFAGIERGGVVFGRGAADDKGPLVQALLAMRALRATGSPRTHTIRLLVGSDEESGSTDIKEYLRDHQAPDFSLVLDSAFPVVVGEKAWDGLTLSVPVGEGMASVERSGAEKFPFLVESLEAGLAPSIVPDQATLTLRWRRGAPDWKPHQLQLCSEIPPAGIRTECSAEGNRLTLQVHGRSAHAGVNIEGGHNALVHLARWVDRKLPPCGAADLLAFSQLAGTDLYGTGLGLTRTDPIWGRYAVNVALIQRGNPLVPTATTRELTLVINLRRTPPLNASESRASLEELVASFNARTGASLSPGGYFQDEPLAFNPRSKLVLRLLEDYRSATGRKEPPAISGGGTYAKRMPRAIAYGMWIPGKPYPGHDVDEKVSVEDLHRGARILLYALVDLAGSEPIRNPFEP